MKRLMITVLACGCHPAPAPAPATPSNIAPPVAARAHRAFTGPRAVIEHKFLHAPISVANPTNQPIDVATATDSVMLVTVPFPSGAGVAQLMLAADGSVTDTMAPTDDSAKVSEGKDDRVIWEITRSGDAYDFQAVRRGIGVFCDAYSPDAKTKYTLAQVQLLVDACADIRVATAGDDASPHYSG